MKKQGSKSFLYGALVLTVGMVLVKVIGALFKIPLKYTVGEYGMGVFSVAYSFYGPVFSLATAGLPVAVSRLISESVSRGRYKDVEAIRKTALPMFSLIGFAGMALMTLFAPVYCRATGSENALPAMLALAPAILFACGSAVYRGYFEGLQNMTPTAVSQVLEAVIKLVLGLTLSRWAAVLGGADELLRLAYGAAGAIVGVTAGSAVSLLYLVLRARRFHRPLSGPAKSFSKPLSKKEILYKLAAITGPVAIGSAAANAAGVIDATVLQSQLSALFRRTPSLLTAQFGGMIPPEYLQNIDAVPTFLFGCYTLAMTVYLLVPSLTQAIGISALPAVTAAWTCGSRENLKENMEAVIKLTALVCFPAGLGISALAEPIARVLYGDQGSSMIVAGVLKLLGPAAVFAAMSTPLSSMLQAAGRADLPVKLLVAAMAVKLCLNRVLCAAPELSLYGAAIGTLVCYGFFSAAQLAALRRVTGVKLKLSGLLLPPGLCGVLCGLTAGACFEVTEPLGTLPALLLSVGGGALIYALSGFLVGFIGQKELNLLPGGQKIAKRLEKWN